MITGAHAGRARRLQIRAPGRPHRSVLAFGCNTCLCFEADILIHDASCLLTGHAGITSNLPLGSGRPWPPLAASRYMSRARVRRMFLALFGAPPNRVSYVRQELGLQYYDSKNSNPAHPLRCQRLRNEQSARAGPPPKADAKQGACHRTNDTKHVDAPGGGAQAFKVREWCQWRSLYCLG